MGDIISSLKINEIFYSIQGESTRVGLPTVFVRTSGCHLRCTYCDTTYAYNSGESMSLNDIITEVKRHQTQYVCLTGGEPLLQKSSFELMQLLCEENFSVSLETSGDISCANINPRVLKIIDVKTPDSGEFGKFCNENIKLNDVNAEFKFVICSEKDFLWAEDFVLKNDLHRRHTILYSPSFNKITPQWLAEKILFQKSVARFQMQLHKYIWSPDTRGV